jgi:hypothetical protein
LGIELQIAALLKIGGTSAIFWNEVHPALKFNMALQPAPEWAGFGIEWLTQRVLGTSRFGKPLPHKWLYPYASDCWRKLYASIVQHRSDMRMN